MRIEILAVDRIRSEGFRIAMEDYMERIARYCAIVRRDVKRGGKGGSRVQVLEGERLLRAAEPQPRDRLIALESDGEALTSEEWAAMLSTYQNEAVGRVVFLVGGAGGLTLAVRQAAHRSVSLGRQTLAHELAQVVLAEQLYRAFTILRGEPYHK